MRLLFPIILSLSFSTLTMAHGFIQLVPAAFSTAVKSRAVSQTCDSQSCQIGATCCNTADGPACCPWVGACCCPDQQHCCVPVDGRPQACVCYGSCPGEGCSCQGCVDLGGEGQCTNVISNPPYNQTNPPSNTQAPSSASQILLSSTLLIAAVLGVCAVAI